ncbi:Uncharacterised protein [Vibrio cholerae]|nr:Uncharacterised protein [Vibrio cholerae]
MSLRLIKATRRSISNCGSIEGSTRISSRILCSIGSFPASNVNFSVYDTAIVELENRERAFPDRQGAQ